MQAVRQTLEAAVRWGDIHTNPAKLVGRNRQPAPRPVRALTRAELHAIAVELSPAYAPCVCRGVPAIHANGLLKPARIYDLPSTFASRRLGHYWATPSIVEP